MIANLVAHLIQFTVWQKDQYSPGRMWFPRILVFHIDVVMRVNVNNHQRRLHTYISLENCHKLKFIHHLNLILT
jgi:hypothetical protein